MIPATSMTNTMPIGILSLGLFLAACGKWEETKIDGKFLLSDRPAEADAPDAITFRPEGSCVFDDGERRGAAGKYLADAAGHIKIEADAGPRKKYKYRYKLLRYTLVLSDDDGNSLYYVRPAEGPHPSFNEILGIFSAHNDLGDTKGEITEDHHFRAHLLTLNAEDHTFYEISMDGSCNYEDGVVTYLPEHSDDPQADKYVRDFIVKRDEKGLWIIDPLHDSLLCETPATNLELPPPPGGYQNARKP